MFTCLAAFATLASVGLADIPALSAEVSEEARTLSLMETTDAPFFAALDDFAADAMALSDALRVAEAPADLPCIFRGISEDARARGADLAAAETESARRTAMVGLRVLLADAIELAPMAAAEAPR